MNAAAGLLSATSRGTLEQASEIGVLFDALVVEIRELRAAVEALTPGRSGRLVDAVTLAGALGVSRAWVYEHRDELGAVRLGGGSRPRLRFDLEVARERFARCSSERSQADQRPDSQAFAAPAAAVDRRRRRSTATRLPEPGSVLRVRPRDRRVREAAG
jgi:hypothetical protein